MTIGYGLLDGLLRYPPFYCPPAKTQDIRSRPRARPVPNKL
jgi:hypothetical protein